MTRADISDKTCEVAICPFQFADVFLSGVEQESVAVGDTRTDDAAGQGVGHVKYP